EQQVEDSGTQHLVSNDLRAAAPGPSGARKLPPGIGVWDRRLPLMPEQLPAASPRPSIQRRRSPTMKRMLACAALLALAGIHPAVAERLYVPVLGSAADGSTLATSVWATSTGEGPAAVRAVGLDESGPRAAREYQVPRGAQVLDGLIAPGAEGL